jgi:hypothetical protein
MYMYKSVKKAWNYEDSKNLDGKWFVAHVLLPTCYTICLPIINIWILCGQPYVL